MSKHVLNTRLTGALREGDRECAGLVLARRVRRKLSVPSREASDDARFRPRIARDIPGRSEP